MLIRVMCNINGSYRITDLKDVKDIPNAWSFMTETFPDRKSLFVTVDLTLEQLYDYNGVLIRHVDYDLIRIIGRKDEPIESVMERLGIELAKTRKERRAPKPKRGDVKPEDLARVEELQRKIDDPRTPSHYVEEFKRQLRSIRS